MARDIFNTAERLYVALQEAEYQHEQHEDTSMYPVLSELGDLDLLPGILGEITDGNGLVTMINSFELTHALHIASNELGYYNSHATILDKARHESQHAEAAAALGLSAVHAIRFRQRPDRGVGMNVTTAPFGGSVTKLAFASMLAHPERLSKSDLRKVQAIGYTNPEEVARRIVDSGADIPMPLSVTKP